MVGSNEPETHGAPDGGLKEKTSGLTQKIIGGIEEVGGALTGDPNTVAEGEFNVEIGEIREELEDAGTEDDGDQ